MKRILRCLLTVALFASLSAQAETPAEFVRRIDEQMTITSDYKGSALIREKRSDGSENVVELAVYRRDATEDLLFLVTNPPSLAGLGDLRIEKNLWQYSPVTGQWDRRTRRADILGTLSCQDDFDRPRLHEDYDAKEEEPEVIQGVKYRKLLLTAKPGLEVVFPVMRLWIDPELKIVKRIGYAPSGKVLRSDVIRAYQKLKDPKTGREILHYREVVEKQEELGTVSVVRYEKVELNPLPANIFTKAWLEGRVRR